MFGYIYKTTNKINNKIYIGQHKASFFEPDVYLGSGTLFRRALKKYGEDSFICELICECFSQQDMDEKEIKFIKEFNSTDSSIGYNITDGGRGGAGPRSDFTKNKISEANKGKTLVNDGIICFRINSCDLPEYLSLGYNHGPLPYNRSDEFKEKVRISNSGKIAMSKGDIRTRVNPNDIEKYLSDGYMVGWVKEEDKVVNKRKKIPGIGKYKYMNKNNIYIMVPESEHEKYLSDGWVFGARKGRKKFIHKRGIRQSDETRKKLSESHKGHKVKAESIEKRKQTMLTRYGNQRRICIIKDDKIKTIYKGNIQKYSDAG